MLPQCVRRRITFLFGSNVRHSVSQYFVSRRFRYPRERNEGWLEWLGSSRCSPVREIISKWEVSARRLFSPWRTICSTMTGRVFTQEKRLRFADLNQSCRDVKRFSSSIIFRIIDISPCEARDRDRSISFRSQRSFEFRERARERDERAKSEERSAKNFPELEILVS